MNDMLDFNEKVIKEFRENKGIVGGPFDGANMLLLTTIGSHTGKLRTTPLVYLKDGQRYIVIASKGGAPDNPQWFNNIVALPQVTIEVGTERIECTAEVMQEPERTQLYTRQEEVMPGFVEYRENTDRVIPVIAITPIS